MDRLSPRILIYSTFLVLLTALLASCASPAARAPASVAPPTRAATAPASHMPKPAQDWLIIDLPANATQAQYGAEVYRLVCQDCHGNQGQGLTPQWRSTWAPADQNCWQSRCHAANHPPEGFILPIAPAIAPRAALSRFNTALDLHDFIQAQMPWYRPGSLIEKDAWAATAHVLVLNHIDPGSLLDAQTAAQIRLR